MKTKRNKPMIFGIFLLLLGLSIIMKAVFHIDIPVFRVVGGLFLIFLGVKMLFGFPRGMRNCDWSSNQSAVFSKQHFSVAQNKEGGMEYNIVFGQGTVDLTDAKVADDKKISVNTVFGNGIVLYDPKQALKITTNSVFGNVETPDGQGSTFGEGQQNLGTSTGTPLKIHVNSVFGSVQFQPKS